MAELNLNYVHSKLLGYGRLGVELADALTKAGITVYDGMISPDLRDQAAQRNAPDRNYGKAETVCWVSTPSHARGWWSGQRPVLFSMFESTNLPESFRCNLNNFETVIVPSEHNMELFGRYHPNVKLATLGVDPEVWHYTPRTPPVATFNFLIGGSGLRKGTDLAYRAFRKVFPEGSWGDGPTPLLVMKNPRGEDFYGERIQVIAGKIPAAAEVDLYAQAHCYLQPSRGEGFGLQPLQALAQGIPTILTDAHGHSSFANLGYGIPAAPAQSGYFIFGDAGDWWEPSFEELCEQMWYVYHHYESCVEEMKTSAQIVARDFTWRRCGELFLDALGGPDALGPYTGDDTWVAPTEELFLLMVNRRHRCDIAGTTYIFEPGVRYYEPADVKRILYEANILDPACITEEPGLLPIQIESLADYQAEHSFCPTCDQKLGTGITRASTFMEAV